MFPEKKNIHTYIPNMTDAIAVNRGRKLNCVSKEKYY